MDNDDTDYVMYIFINTSLSMGKGKIASQSAHIAQSITEEIIRSGYENRTPPISYYDYEKWKKYYGSKKIVLKATIEQMDELLKLENSRYIIDAGRTQIASGSMTVIGFFPSNKLTDIFKNYKLL